MEALLTLEGLLTEAFANGAVGFTLRTGLHPLIYSNRGTRTYDTQPSTSEDLEEFLRPLVDSRKMRQLRAEGEIHFNSVFEDHISLRGQATFEGEDIQVELRKASA